MFKKSYLLLLVAAFFICLTTVTANAVPIFSDLGPANNLYDTSSAASVFDLAPNYAEPASQFTAGGGIIGSSIDVTQIDVAVVRQLAGGTTGNFSIKIWTSSSNLPGTTLYTSPTTLTPNGGLVTLSGITGLSLTVGDPYFLSVTPVTNGDSAWYRNSQGVLGRAAHSTDHEATWSLFSTSNPPDFPLFAFDILGSAPTGVPEPCTMLLLGLSLMGVAGIRKKIGK
jgi:hypothetical protein